jgi:hypothetical protein
VKFDVPAKLGDLSKVIDFRLPGKGNPDQFQGDNLSLIAMDESEPSRVRIASSSDR